MAKSTSPPPNLLTIPTELRLHIYTYLSLLYTNISACIGLIGSCKKIHEEAHEIIKNTGKYLKAIEERYNWSLDDPARFTMPENLKDCDRIELFLSKYMVLSRHIDETLRNLNIEELTILPARSLNIRILGRPERPGWNYNPSFFPFVTCLHAVFNRNRWAVAAPEPPLPPCQVQHIVFYWSEEPCTRVFTQMLEEGDSRYRVSYSFQRAMWTLIS